MKNILSIILLVINFFAFSQGNPASTFNYKAKFEGVNDATKVAPIITSMKMVFKTAASFNESTNMIEFSSKMSISKTVFNNMMSGEGFQVESFERREIKSEAPVEIKKVTTIDTTSKNKTLTVKKDAPKNEPSKTGK